MESLAVTTIERRPVGNFTSAETDDQLITLWLHDKAAHSERAYRADVARFVAYVGKPLGAVTLGDLQGFADSLSLPGRGDKLSLTPAGRRAMAAVKSLLAFGQRVGYLQFNVGAAVRVKKDTQGRLAERILPESDVHRLIALETNPRNHALLRFLYVTAVRVSELCQLRWADMLSNDDGSGTVIVEGKGGRERTISVEAAPWAEVVALRGGARPDAPVFASRQGGHLDTAQVWRIVRAAARRAGIAGDVSPHWIRHAHASHAIERGAPLPLVRDTLGHASISTTDVYAHARQGDSSGRYLSA